MREARFDLIWLPPPSFAGTTAPATIRRSTSAWTTATATSTQHRSMLAALLETGVEPVADIVINHRDGSQALGGFPEPRLGHLGDHARRRGVHQPAPRSSARRSTSEGRRRSGRAYAQQAATTYPYGSFRDIDHTNKGAPRPGPLPAAAKEHGLSRLALRHGARLPRQVDRRVQPRIQADLLRRRVRLGRPSADSVAGSGTRPRSPAVWRPPAASSISRPSSRSRATRAITGPGTGSAPASAWSATPRTGFPGRTGR